MLLKLKQKNTENSLQRDAFIKAILLIRSVIVVDYIVYLYCCSRAQVIFDNYVHSSTECSTRVWLKELK